MASRLYWPKILTNPGTHLDTEIGNISKGKQRVASPPAPLTTSVPQVPPPAAVICAVQTWSLGGAEGGTKQKDPSTIELAEQVTRDKAPASASKVAVPKRVHAAKGEGAPDNSSIKPPVAATRSLPLTAVRAVPSQNLESASKLTPIRDSVPSATPAVQQGATASTLSPLQPPRTAVQVEKRPRAMVRKRSVSNVWGFRMPYHQQDQGRS